VTNKHTPGPWYIGGELIYSKRLSWNGAERAVEIASVWHRYQGGDRPAAPIFDEAEANAKLIHAAPLLLEALVNLVTDLTEAEENKNPETGDEYNSVRHAREAIREAGGAAPEPSDKGDTAPELASFYDPGDNPDHKALVPRAKCKRGEINQLHPRCSCCGELVCDEDALNMTNVCQCCIEDGCDSREGD
jgi:hypothetical protein